MVKTLVKTFNPSSILLDDFSDMCDFCEFVFEFINRGQNRPGPSDFDVCIANDVSCAIVTILQRKLHLIFQLFDVRARTKAIVVVTCKDNAFFCLFFSDAEGIRSHQCLSGGRKIEKSQGQAFLVGQTKKRNIHT